jgi:hypothetical protein
VTIDAFSERDVKSINARIKYLHETNMEVRLKFPRLDANTSHLLVYSDVSFGARNDKSSQARYTCILSDNS